MLYFKDNKQLTVHFANGDVAVWSVTNPEMPHILELCKKAKWGEIETLNNINKAIMRCLVKNLAMFGLGLGIYAGEDLPIDIDTSDINIKEVLAKAESWHERLEALGGYEVKNPGTVREKF